METLEMLKIAANALNEKKAKALSALEIADLTMLCEYFLICTATSSTHVRALCEEVEAKLEEAGIRPHHIEGKSTGWVALDYGSLIVHIFTQNDREFYSLDRMWSDGKPIDLDEILVNTQGD